MTAMFGALHRRKENWTRVDTHRLSVFSMAVLVGLASGSNYGYSAYAPQLASKLSISSTQVNLVGVSGNLGMYAMGPIWGKMIDSRGQRLPLILASICIFTGYITVYLFYKFIIPIRPPSTPISSDPHSQAPPSIPGLFVLCFAMFLTGCGGAAGLSASVNAVAKSFSDTTRASASGMVFAGFGLSAFTFSTLGHTFFPGDAGGLLLLLAVGTSVPMFVGGLVIRPVPPDGAHLSGEQEGYQPVLASPGISFHDDNEEDRDEATDYSTHTHTRSTSMELSRSISPRSRNLPHSSLNIDTPHPNPSIPPKPSHSTSSASSPRLVRSRSHSNSSVSPTDNDMSPSQLLFSTDFRCLFTVLAILCGCGLMYINNVGTIALALARKGEVEYDGKVVGAWQARQVATISIWNCLGRVIGGVSADFCKSRFGIRRVWFLPIVALLFISAQLSALHTTQVEDLWLVSMNLGLAYGSLFNVVPMLVLEWFGMTHFSQNFGWTNVGPVLGGNLFNLLFGRIYDSNAVSSKCLLLWRESSCKLLHLDPRQVGHIGSNSTEPAVSSGPISSGPISAITKLAERAGQAEDHHACLLGEGCYGSAFKITTIGCFVALCISLGLGIRRQRELSGGHGST